MKKSQFTEEQIVLGLRQVEFGTKVVGLCRKMSSSEQTFCLWKKKYSGISPGELKRLKELEGKNRNANLS